MIKNKIKLLQLFCFLCAGGLERPIDRELAKLGDYNQFANFITQQIECFSSIKRCGLKVEPSTPAQRAMWIFNAMQKKYTYEQYLAYIQQTAEMSDFEEKMSELNSRIPDDNALSETQRNSVHRCIKAITRACTREWKSMRHLNCIGPEVNCAIIGIIFRRQGAIEDFLRECTDARMIDFVSQASELDLNFMQNHIFINAVRDNPALKARLAQIDAAIQENVESEHQKELWIRYKSGIFDQFSDEWEIVSLKPLQ